jgi:hypothetical protein
MCILVSLFIQHKFTMYISSSHDLTGFDIKRLSTHYTSKELVTVKFP